MKFIDSGEVWLREWLEVKAYWQFLRIRTIWYLQKSKVHKINHITILLHEDNQNMNEWGDRWSQSAFSKFKLAVLMNCFLGMGREKMHWGSYNDPQALLFLLFVQITVKKKVKYNACLWSFLVLWLLASCKLTTINKRRFKCLRMRNVGWAQHHDGAYGRGRPFNIV